MFRNYFMIALRSYIRNRTTSLLNFLGLTVGIVSSFLIFLYVQWVKCFQQAGLTILK